MIDYIDITKHFENKVTINFAHLQLEATYNSGWKKYVLKGCTHLEVWINQQLSLVRIKGSIPYFFQGHNFIFCNKSFNEAIKYLNNILNYNFWDATVNAFEYGIIFEVPTKPSEYIQHHRERSQERLIFEEKPKDKGSFRWWKDKYVKLKMYDAGKNIIHKQGLSMKEIIKKEGWNPSLYYLKWEVHYTKPHLALNKGKAIKLADLVNPKWTKTLNENLLIQYQRLNPLRTIEPPLKKKDISTANILMLECVEYYINQGYSIKEIKKKLYKRIDTYTVLSESDKKARKRQISSITSKLNESEISEWDLSELILNNLFPPRA